MEKEQTVFHGELQLTAWGDSSTTGPWVKFWCHPDDLEMFKLLRMRKGNKEAGTRLATVMVEIGEDEAVVLQAPPAEVPAATPAPSPRPRTYHAPHIGALGMLAVRWCKDHQFHEWLFDHEANQQWLDSVYARKSSNEQAAKEWILETSGLVAKHGAEASRKHLDTDPEAAQKFQDRVRIPFMEYLSAQQE